MRTSQTACLAAAIALALAGQAYAATAVKAASTGTTATTAGTTSSGTVTSGTAINGTNGALIRSSTAIQTPVNASTTATGGTTTTNNGNATFKQPQNATTVDVRNEQTQQAVAGTHASGSTSALGPLATGNASVNSPTTAGTGTTSGAGATGTGSSTGTSTDTTTTTGTGAAVGTSGVPTVNGFPVIGGAGVVGANGVVIIPSGGSADVTSGLAATQGNSMLANGIATNDVLAGAVLVPEATSAANGASVNRAINQVSRDRKRVGRNGQLLYSIAPRSNGVDRSKEMPDDGPSPALTGSNSTLTR